MRPAQSSSRFVARLHDNLEAVARTWQDFEAQGGATVFQTFSWACTIRDELLPSVDASLMIVEVVDRQDGRPLLLLPMVRFRRALHHVITWLDFGVCDYAAPLILTDVTFDAAAVAEIWAAVYDVLPFTDLIHITRLPDRILSSANPFVELRSCRRMSMQSFAVSLAGESDSLIRRLGQGSTGRELQRRRRKLSEKGTIRFVAAVDHPDVDRIFDALLLQRQERFGAIGRRNLLDRADVAGFYRSAAHRGLDGGPVRLFGLWSGPTCIATVYGLVDRAAFHMVIPTMAEGSWRSFAPGLQLIADTILWAKAEGLAQFDFTIGHQPYKADFGGMPSDLFEIYEAISLKGHVIMLSARCAATVKSWLQRRPSLFGRLRSHRQRLRRWRLALSRFDRVIRS